jgi:Sulfatase
VAWLHLATLSAFAIARPLFEVLADSPEFFVARGNTSGDIVVLAFGVCLVPPSVLLVLELPFAWTEAAWAAIHAAFVGLLCSLIALQALGGLADGPSGVLIGLAIVLGAVAGLAYRRTQALKYGLSLLSPAPLLVLVLFLVFSPVSKLLWGNEPAAEAAVHVDGSTPVVFLIFDELSLASLLDAHDRIDTGRYPNIARLSRDSTWYRGATTVADETGQAVPAILTGKRPDHGLLPTHSDHPDNLFTLLGGSYSMHARESVTRLCPEDVCEQSRDSTSTRLESLVSDLSVVSLHLLLPEDLESDLPAVDRTFSGFGDSDSGPEDQAFRWGIGSGPRGETFASFVRGIRSEQAGRPTLNFHHSQLPHVPWQYLPTGQRYQIPREPDIPGAAPPPWSRQPVVSRESFRRYLEQVEYVDRLVGATVRKLRETGLYERALLVLCSDHGLSFRPGQPRRLVNEVNFADLAGVPMIIKAPHQRRGRVVDSPALTVDILPTVARLLSTQVPWRTDGRPLTGAPRPPATRLRIDSFDRDVLRRPYEAYRAELRAAAAREMALGGEPSPLLGRAAAGLPAAGRETSEVSYDDPERYASVRPSATVLPVFVTGRLLQGARAGLRLAVVVNGRVRAVTQSYSEGGMVGFGALIPVAALKPGRNQVEILAVRGTRAKPALAPFASAARRLVDRDGRTFLESPAGESIALRPGAVGGFVETRGEIAHRVVFAQGWAGDTKSAQPADRLYLFSRDRLLSDAPPSRVRPDLRKLYGAAMRRAGFVLGGTAEGGGELPDPGSLRVVAVLGDRASELPVLKGG